MDQKVIVGLAAVVTGWLLAQASGIVKDRLNRRRIRRGLLQELEELSEELNRNSLYYARQLQIYALRGIGDDIPLFLSNHIFKNYYKDAVLSLNQAQRISLQMIHSYVDVINQGIDDQRAISSQIQHKRISEGLESIGTIEGELWGGTVKAGFANTATAIWHIRNHLRAPKSPDLTIGSPTHENYLKYLQNVHDQIREICSAATKLERGDFEVKYRPADFLSKAIPNIL